MTAILNGIILIFIGIWQIAVVLLKIAVCVGLIGFVIYGLANFST